MFICGCILRQRAALDITYGRTSEVSFKLLIRSAFLTERFKNTLNIILGEILMNGRNIDSIVVLGLFRQLINDRLCLRHIRWSAHLFYNRSITDLDDVLPSVLL